MSSVISYEVNQLGAGRWQRSSAPVLPAARPPAAIVAQQRLGWRVRPGQGLVAIGFAVALVAALLLNVGSQGVSAALSSYAGVGGSYPLVASVSGVGPLALASAPPRAISPGAVPPPPASGASLAQRKPSVGDYNLLGKPSISVATIEQVLKQYNSPAVGNGQAFYDLGVKYGVDPAFMLAFYIHESAAGTAGAAVATRSVGNIICAGWGGKCIGRFRAYDSYAQAAEDWYQLITGPLYIGGGLTTPPQITPRYAPNSDNNDSAGYARTVERLVDEWRVQQP